MFRALTFVILISLLLAGCGMPPAPTTAPLQAETASPAPTAFPSPEILPTPTLIPTPVPDTLYVDPDALLGPISPLAPGGLRFGSHHFALSGRQLGDHNDVRPLQIDQFMDFAGRVGATAIFNVRLLEHWK